MEQSQDATGWCKQQALEKADTGDMQADLPVAVIGGILIGHMNCPAHVICAQLM